MATENSTEKSMEEEDNLARSTKRNKVDGAPMGSSPSGGVASSSRPSYKESLFNGCEQSSMETDVADNDSDCSEDDLSDDEVVGPMFSMGMTKEAKIAARKP